MTTSSPTTNNADLILSAAFEAAAAERVFRVPVAENWTNGMVLKDDQGQFFAKVQKHEKYGRVATGDAKWRVTLVNDEDLPIAVILRKVEGGKDTFDIYSTKPNWFGQAPEPYLDERGVEESYKFDIYPLTELTQGVFGGAYVLRFLHDKKIILKAKNRNVTWMLICCPMAIMLGCCPWNLHFYEPGSRRRGSPPAIVRNQDTQTVRVAPGSSPLLGICMAYAVDRQLTISC